MITVTQLIAALSEIMLTHPDGIEAGGALPVVVQYDGTALHLQPTIRVQEPSTRDRTGVARWPRRPTRLITPQAVVLEDDGLPLTIETPLPEEPR